MPRAVRFCLRGHDTWQTGRDSKRKCRACAREAAVATYRAEEALRRAEEHEARERERRKADRARERWRRSLRGEDLLEQLQIEAQLDGRCIWEVSLSPPRVCGVRVRAPDVTPYCRRHDRLVEAANEAYKRGKVKSAEEFYRAKGVIP